MNPITKPKIPPQATSFIVWALSNKRLDITTPDRTIQAIAGSISAVALEKAARANKIPVRPLTPNACALIFKKNVEIVVVTTNAELSTKNLVTTGTGIFKYANSVTRI